MTDCSDIFLASIDFRKKKPPENMLAGAHWLVANVCKESRK